DFATERALKQHQDVMHNDRYQQQRLGDAIVTGLQRTGVISGGDGASPQAIVAAVAATLQALGYGSPPARPEPQPAEEDEDERPAAPQRRHPISDAQRRANERRRERRAAARRVPITTE